MSTLQHRIFDGKYRLVRQLVEGGMGSLWLAEHLSLHSPVAVKLIAKEVAETEEGLQRFLREARTAASIRSPHVVQILDYGVDLGTPYIVMELLDGESLAQRLERLGQLTAAETERIIWQISRAVGRAHDAGIVHRDLKPANIFIVDNDDEEVVKLLDFGIAKASSDAFSASIASNTRTGAFVGTPFYVSPEQAEGVKQIDHRSDIWSMGVIAYECLLGCVPFTGETFGSLVLSICSRPLPIPSKLGSVPAAFDGWFASACARDPAERFPSARDAAQELRAALEIAPIDNAPPRRPRRAQPALERATPAAAAARGASDAAVAVSAPAAIGNSAPSSSVTTSVASSAAVTERTGSPQRARALLLGGVLAVLVVVGVLLARSDPRTGAASNDATPGAGPTSAPRGTSPASPAASDTPVASAAGLRQAEPSLSVGTPPPSGVEPSPAGALPGQAVRVAAPEPATPSPSVAAVPKAPAAAPDSSGRSPRAQGEVRPKRGPSRARRNDRVESAPASSVRAARSDGASAASAAQPSPGDASPAAASAPEAAPPAPEAAPLAPAVTPPPPAATPPAPAARKRSVNLGF